MKLKIYLTPNIEKLTSLVEQSYGNVLLRLPDNFLRDLKNDSEAAAFLKQEADRCHGVEIHLTDTKDYFKFINFMMGGCVCTSFFLRKKAGADFSFRPCCYVRIQSSETLTCKCLIYGSRYTRC